MTLMLMSAVSAEENITDDGAITSDNIEIDSNQGYNVSDDSIQEVSLIDDENISEDDTEPASSSNSADAHYAIADYEFNVIAKGSAAMAGASFDKDFSNHRSSSFSHYPKNFTADMFNERSIDEKFSDFQYPANMAPEALNDIINDISGESLSWKISSSYSEYFNMKLDSLKNLIDENEIGDVFNGNAPIIDFKTIDYLKHNLISFMDAGAKYADSSIGNLFDVDAFFDILDKIMNLPSTHNVMTNIPSANNDSTLRNSKYYSDYGLYTDSDSIMNYYDLSDDEESSIESDGNISDMIIIQDNIELTNQTFDLKTVQDVCIASYDDMKSNLQLSDAGDCRHDTYNNFDESPEMQSLKFSKQIDCLPSNISEDLQNTFYHIIGCECSNTSFTKQYDRQDNLPEVNEFDTITSTEQEDNHDNILFKKYNVNAPFIVENTSVFALFGVIKITIP